MPWHRFLSLLLLCCLVPLSSVSQDKKPKVALVLSGGGAKGIAHIPLLQALDSLGIVPDLVVGNSMGSMVGGLYAMGYSGDSIAKIASSTDWDNLMGGGISLNDVTVEEESEFNRYMISLSLENRKFRLGNSLINDQNLRTFISYLTYPAHKVNDFDDLSIPFRAMATDIVNGKEVILESGSLSFAMRASISIPGIFSAVPYNETLLVDGGVLNNFPVDVAKNLGADIIIGSDVGGNMLPKEKLESLSALMFQAGMLNSNLKNPESRALCDILIDHYPNLTYSTSDFAKSRTMMEEGKIAVSENSNALVALAERLKGFDQRTHQIPDVADKITLDKIVFKGISKGNRTLVRERANLKPHTPYSVQDLKSGIDRAMGTARFTHINYGLQDTDDSLVFEVRGFERSKHQFKGSLHFDTDNSVGLVLNYTGFNVLGTSSRSLATIDLAERPKIRLQHQASFGSQKAWWWRAEFMGQQQKEKVFVLGEYVDDINYRNGIFDNQLNLNLNSLINYIGFGLKYEYTGLKPTIDPNVNDNFFQFERYRFDNFEIYGQYRHNSMNKVFFATQGTSIQGYLGRSLYSKVDIDYSLDSAQPVKGQTNGFTKLGLDYEVRIPVSQETTLIVGAASHFFFEDPLNDGDISSLEFGLGAKYILGGNIENPRYDTRPFPGLNQKEVIANQYVKLALGTQINLLRKVFLTPHVDLASVGFGTFDDFTRDFYNPKGEWQNGLETSLLFSAGSTISYASLLGPINFDLSWVNGTNNLRFFVGVGYNFN
ncbi:patatin-like phospholipase family protein [Robiginitalea sp. M39]|uniref:Patatin-like phospholipase family protein n=1 Tax=Robiginitalea aurantiaca TaxID=3056915 RepID=A0ABT7WDA0_9FLAO|nr:patatin-like phospholipase family protein [Robiginitalea aurantiaca]